VAVESLLSMGEDSIKDHVIKVNPPVENDGWLHPDLVTMATYILHTCPIHTRYVRRGLGEHRTKGAKEYFLSSKQMESLGMDVPDVQWQVDRPIGVVF